MSDLLQFLHDVFWHWQGWLGGTGFGGAVVVLVGLYERLSGHVMSRRRYVTLFIVAFLFGAFFLAWRDQYHRANDADAKLEESKPRFEIQRGTIMVSNVDKTEAGPVLFTAVSMPIVVFNHGAPSIIRGWSLTAKLQGGRILSGSAWMPLEGPLKFHDPRGNLVTVERSQFLFVRGTTPIPRGGQTDGFAIFTFPPGLKEEMSRPPTIFTFEISDIEGKSYPVEVPMTGKQADYYMLTPGLVPK